MTEIDVPYGVEYIGYWAFADCSNVTKITIPSSVVETGIGPFGANISARELYYDAKVSFNTDIITSTNSFKNLETVILGDNVPRLQGGLFDGCSYLKSAIIGKQITEIPSYIFRNCTNLTDIVMKGNVTVIGYYAFNGCSKLRTIKLPDSVTEIQDNAFYNCSKL